MPFAATWMDLETVILRYLSDTERQLSYAITSMWNPKKKYKRTYLQNVSRVMDVEKIMATRRVKLGDWD